MPKWIPNALSLIRLGLAFLFPFVSSDTWMIIILIALSTEFLDGFLARRFNAITTLGRFLDPIADKAFVITVCTILAFSGLISPPIFFGVLSRDLIVIVGTLSLLALQRWDMLTRLEPGYAGKVATVLQFIFFCSVVQLKRVEMWLFYPTAAVSVLAGVTYVASNYRFLRQSLDDIEADG